MQLGLIFAQSRNGIIGKDGDLPWHLPEDLAHFKRVTMGCPVIMGRKTWDSLPERFRPLPGRANIVVTRQPDWHAQGAVRADSLESAVAQCAGHDLAWVIGGAQIYAQALPLAHRAEVTDIHADFEGDSHAPVFGPNWVETGRESHESATGLHYGFVSYRNNLNQGD